MLKGKYTHRTKCRLCGSKEFTKIFDLGWQPLAGEFLEKKQIGKEKYYPLRLYKCNTCNLVQLLDIVDRKKLFQSFLSSVSMTKHFEDYAKEMKKRFLKKGDFVVEIGSNDGVLLKPLMNMGIEVLGIEPVRKIAKIAQDKGVPTKVKYFSEKVAKSIKKKADAVFANNVFAHIDDMDDVMRGIDFILKEGGLFVIEVHSAVKLFEQKQWDNIYHEHLSYYSIAPLSRFLEKYGFEIFEVKQVATHSGSFRVYARKRTYDHFNLKDYADDHGELLCVILEALKSKGLWIIGYGASGRANTMLNYNEIGIQHIDYIIDESPARFSNYTPGTHIPVFPKSELMDYIDYVLILAWNYEKEIRKKLKAMGYKGKFIIPFPEIKII